MPPPWGGVLARFYRPGGGGFELFFCPGGGGFELFFAQGVGNSPIKKIARGDGQAWN